MLIYIINTSMKWLWIFLLALLVTVALFISMKALIQNDHDDVKPIVIDVYDGFIMPEAHIEPIIDEVLPTRIENALPVPEYANDYESTDNGSHSTTFSHLLEDYGEIVTRYVIPKQFQPSFRVPPIYPARAKQQGIEGYVDVRFTLNAVGRPQQIQIIAADPEYIFDSAVIKAVAKWRYEPVESHHGLEVEERLRFKIRHKSR